MADITLLSPRQGSSSGASAESRLWQQMLQEAMDLLPDSVLFLDREWNFTFANRHAVALLGSGPLVGDNLWKLFPHNRLEPFHSSYRTTMEQRIATEFEAFYPEPLHRWFRVSARPFEEGIGIFFADITEQKAAEERRDEAMQRLEQVFEATADSIVCIGPDWRCTYANARAHELLGDRNLVGSDLWTRFPGNQQEPFASNYRRAMRERVVTRFEAHYADPLHIWFHVVVRPFQDGIVIASSDITARKLAELERDRTSAALGQVLDVTNDGVIALDRDWKITFANRRGAELTAPAGNIVSKNLWKHFPEAASADLPYMTHYHRAMDERIASSFEAYYPDPLNLWLKIEARPSPDGIIVFFRDITADRNRIEELHRQAELLRAVQQAALIATWELDLDSGAVLYGAGSYPVFGRPLEETATLASLERWIPEPELRRFRQNNEDATTSGGALRQEFPVTAANGDVLWIESRGQVVRRDGRATHLRGISVDVTARKLAIEALAASETQFRVLTDLNPQFIWMGAADGRVTYANQRFLGYIGKQHAPDDTGRWLEAFDPADRARVMDCWMRSITTGEDYSIQARMIRDEDQASRWFHVRAQPLRNEAGVIQNWLGVAIDIHESRTFAETLRERQMASERQRAELESIYENTPIGLALFDPVEFRYLRINDELARTIGMPKEQILGRSVLEIVPGVATIGELFRQASTGKPVRDRIVEAELADQPGNTRSWNVNYFPIRDSTGAITGITTASLEITQQRKAEAALIQAEKLAAVGRLASSISHEINNPLEAITNLLYLVAQAADLPQELKIYVHMAQAELQRVSQIATQTLRFHRQAVGATLVTAKQLVNAVLNLYQGRLVNSGIEVSAIYGSETEILCFENDIRQVLNNLIANAIDAMRTGGRLVVRAHDAHDAASGRAGVRIAIADTGHGMSRTTQRRLFEPFYTTKGLNGTGLGLWISSEIVKRHEGRMQVRSTQHPVHHGTVFTLFLPLRESAETQSASKSSPSDLP